MRPGQSDRICLCRFRFALQPDQLCTNGTTRHAALPEEESRCSFSDYIGLAAAHTSAGLVAAFNWMVSATSWTLVTAIAVACFVSDAKLAFGRCPHMIGVTVATGIRLACGTSAAVLPARACGCSRSWRMAGTV